MPKPRNADGGRLAPAMNLNSVKVYNLSSVGKALPAWLSAGKRKALVQKKEDNERRSSLSKLAVVAPPLATRCSLGHRLWLWARFRTLRACAALRPGHRRQASSGPPPPFRRVPTAGSR